MGGLPSRAWACFCQTTDACPHSLLRGKPFTAVHCLPWWVQLPRRLGLCQGARASLPASGADGGLSARQASFVRDHPEGRAREETAFPFWALSHQLWVCEKRQVEGWCLKQAGCGQRDSFCEDRTMPPSPGGMLGSHSLCLSASKAGWVCTHSRCFPTLMDGGLRTCSISGERKSRKM